ncbi:MAG: hypothetical protein ACFB01_10850 [Cohaesibacteraceae bacterium]
MEDEIEAFAERLGKLELMNERLIAAMPMLIDGFALPFLASITLDGSSDFIDGKRSDTITKERTSKCVVTVKVSMEYKDKKAIKGEDGKAVVAHEYTVVTTITVEEVCSGADGSKFKRVSSTHKSKATYPLGKTDKPKTGESTLFNGTEVDTLDYPHGTKVKVTKTKDPKDESKNKVKVDITYPNGQTDSVTVPS